MKKIEREEIEFLQSELTAAWPDIVRNIESRITAVAKIQNNFGITGLADPGYTSRYLAGQQATADCTKDFQTYVTAATELVCYERGIPLHRNEVDGSDWLFAHNLSIPIEQKCRTILSEHGAYKNYLFEGQVYNGSWTGNKNAALVGSKTDIHLLSCFELRGSSIVSSTCNLISLEQNKTKWTAKADGKGSFAGLTMNANSAGIYPIWGDTVFVGKRNRPLKSARFFLRGLQ